MNATAPTANRLASILPSKEEFDCYMELARHLTQTGFLPSSVRTPEQGLAIMLRGRDFGLSVMESFAALHVVEGKVECSADFMHAQVRLRTGCKIQRVEHTPTRCTLLPVYPDGSQGEPITWTIEQARDAGITRYWSKKYNKWVEKMPWKTSPRAMLHHRCCSELCRAEWPEIFYGVYAPGEISGVEWDEPGAATEAAAAEATSEAPRDGSRSDELAQRLALPAPAAEPATLDQAQPERDRVIDGELVATPSTAAPPRQAEAPAAAGAEAQSEDRVSDSAPAVAPSPYPADYIDKVRAAAKEIGLHGRSVTVLAEKPAAEAATDGVVRRLSALAPPRGRSPSNLWRVVGVAEGEKPTCVQALAAIVALAWPGAETDAPAESSTPPNEDEPPSAGAEPDERGDAWEGDEPGDGQASTDEPAPLADDAIARLKALALPRDLADTLLSQPADARLSINEAKLCAAEAQNRIGADKDARLDIWKRAGRDITPSGGMPTVEQAARFLLEVAERQAALAESQ